MIRFFLGGLLFVVAALAVIFQDPLLIAGAAILLLIVLITFVIGARDKRRKKKSSISGPKSPEEEKDQDLRAHGILEVRPVGEDSSVSRPIGTAQERSSINDGFASEHIGREIEPVEPIEESSSPLWKRENRGEIVDPEADLHVDESWVPVESRLQAVEGPESDHVVEPLGFDDSGIIPGSVAVVSKSMTDDEDLSGELFSREEIEISENDTSDLEFEEESQEEEIEEDMSSEREGAVLSGTVSEGGAVSNDLVRPFLESVRTASSASTLCLLRVDQARKEFRVLDVLSDSSKIRRSARFPYDSYFLADFSGSETMRIQVADGGITGSDLGYYSESLALADLVVCPIVMNGELMAHLLADVSDGDEPFSSDEFDILDNSGRLLGEMLSVHGGFQVREELDPIGDYIPAEPLRLVSLSTDEPYNMIIEEEVNRARMTETPLALALIHVQNREEVKLGEAVVAEIEHLMRKDLERIHGTGRVERVGEMAFGVFIRGQVEEVEEWINQAQYHFADSSYEIPGDVIIGAACLSSGHQSSEAFRVSAGQAFKEAYETGENTILVS